MFARVLSFAFGMWIAAPGMTQAQDTSLWNSVLSKYAEPRGFDYEGLLADEDTLAALHTYVAQLGSMPEDAPLADWLNAYNALVVYAVTERFPIYSVRSVPRFFRGIKYQVAGERRTLDDLEHGIIRPRFADPRIHVALNCGAQSCPPLQSQAFYSKTLDATLDELSRRVVSDPKFVAVRGDFLSVSKIFFWYAKDFEERSGSVLEWLKQYDTTGRLEEFTSETRLKRLPYDWKLNAATEPG